MMHLPHRHVVVIVCRRTCGVPVPDKYLRMGKMSRDIEHDNEWGHAGEMCIPTLVVIISRTFVSHSLNRTDGFKTLLAAAIDLTVLLWRVWCF